MIDILITICALISALWVACCGILVGIFVPYCVLGDSYSVTGWRLAIYGTLIHIVLCAPFVIVMNAAQTCTATTLKACVMEYL